MCVHVSLNIQAFLMCPKLKPYRQQLTTRLSRTLINRRLFVHRQRRKGILLPKAQPLTNTVKALPVPTSKEESVMDPTPHVQSRNPPSTTLEHPAISPHYRPVSG